MHISALHFPNKNKMSGDNEDDGAFPKTFKSSGFLHTVTNIFKFFDSPAKI